MLPTGAQQAREVRRQVNIPHRPPAVCTASDGALHSQGCDLVCPRLGNREELYKGTGRDKVHRRHRPFVLPRLPWAPIVNPTVQTRNQAQRGQRSPRNSTRLTAKQGQGRSPDLLSS